jgi:hypothetical protein
MANKRKPATNNTMVDNEQRQLLVNELSRNLCTMFPGFFGGDAKHTNLYGDFGWPQKLTFSNYYQMYQRNGLAYAGITKPIETCWQEYPELQEQEDTHDKTALEKQIADKFEEIGFWGVLSKADEFSRIGEYAGVIFRFADNKDLREPVDSTSLGLDGLVEVIPALQGQLKPAERDQTGRVLMWQYNEAGIPDNAENTRMETAMIHPDRVHVWSANGSIFGKPALEAGYNDLLGIQKINGAGPEGFWKNAKAAPWLEVEKDMAMSKLATALGTNNVNEIPDKLDEVVGDWQKGYDQSLMLQGIKANFNKISLDDPEPHLQGLIQSFAASLSIPAKILVGSQTGERASTEDAKEWAKTCNSRNTKLVKPNIRRIIRQKLVAYGILPAREWYLLWPDLTEATTSEKFAIAKDMADINAKNRGSGEPITYTANEIRETTGWDDLAEEDIPRRDPNSDETTQTD